MAFQNGHAFSTKDRDNDTWSKNCATHCKGGWWYSACHRANLNGLYLENKSSLTTARWWHWKKNQSMKTTSMKIHRKFNN